MVRLGKQLRPGMMLSMLVLRAQTLACLSGASPESYLGHKLQEAFA